MFRGAWAGDGFEPPMLISSPPGGPCVTGRPANATAWEHVDLGGLRRALAAQGVGPWVVDPA
ncbi:hypothetical protein V6S02_09490 [Microbacterium sp. CCNWLW134]|uniref:hypothetical protein n=1 Tax=Microbacterium sp. CCNWLW134 TaxID=3122064 RepID=UPI003010593E